jgi:hypothetical protein
LGFREKEGLGEYDATDMGEWWYEAAGILAK